MELQNIFQKKIQRKNFFISLSIGIASFFIMKSLPFRFLGKKVTKNNSLPENKIKIRINPSAISRTKLGENNGRS